MPNRSPNRTVSKHINLTLLGDMPERIDQARDDGETRVAFIRKAIEFELVRRAQEREATRKLAAE